MGRPQLVRFRGEPQALTAPFNLRHNGVGRFGERRAVLRRQHLIGEPRNHLEERVDLGYGSVVETVVQCGCGAVQQRG